MSLKRNSGFIHKQETKEKRTNRFERKSHLQLNKINWERITQLSSFVYARMKKINERFISQQEDDKDKSQRVIQEQADQKGQKLIEFSSQQGLHDILDIQYSQQILEESIYVYLEIMGSSKGIVGARMKNILKKYDVKDRKNRKKTILKNRNLYRYCGEELFSFIALTVENSIHPSYHRKQLRQQVEQQQQSLKDPQIEESQRNSDISKTIEGSNIIYNEKLEIPLISDLDSLEKQWIGLDFFNKQKSYDWQEIENYD